MFRSQEKYAEVQSFRKPHFLCTLSTFIRDLRKSGKMPKTMQMTVLIKLLVTFCLAGQVFAQTQNVRVIGQGESVYEARQDAVRQALQMSVEQLVFSQQIVENDQLTLDRIASTMNGFVTSFDVVRNWSEDGAFFLEANIGISESRIENFIGAIGGQRTQLDSNQMFAAANAERLAARARGEVVLGLLQDLSPRALEVRNATFSLNEINPEIIDYSYEIGWSPAFLRSLEQGMEALGAQKVYCEYQGPILNAPSSSCLSVPPFSTVVCFSKRGAERADAGFSSPFESRFETVCHVLPRVDLSMFDMVEFDPRAHSQSVLEGYFSAALFNQNGELLQADDVNWRENRANWFLPAFSIRQYRWDYSGQTAENIYVILYLGGRKPGILALESVEQATSIETIPTLLDGSANLISDIFPHTVVYQRNGQYTAGGTDFLSAIAAFRRGYVPSPSPRIQSNRAEDPTSVDSIRRFMLNSDLAPLWRIIDDRVPGDLSEIIEDLLAQKLDVSRPANLEVLLATRLEEYMELLAAGSANLNDSHHKAILSAHVDVLRAFESAPAQCVDYVATGGQNITQQQLYAIQELTNLATIVTFESLIDAQKTDEDSKPTRGVSQLDGFALIQALYAIGMSDEDIQPVLNVDFSHPQYCQNLIQVIDVVVNLDGESGTLIRSEFVRNMKW